MSVTYSGESRTWRLQCDRCPITYDLGGPQDIGPEEFVTAMLATTLLGWRVIKPCIGQRVDFCPTCNETNGGGDGKVQEA